MSNQRSDIDLDDFDLDPLNLHRACAILLPKSPSAIYSTSLAENRTKLAYITPYGPPNNSDLEDDRRIRSFNILPSDDKRDRYQQVIILEQTHLDEISTSAHSMPRLSMRRNLLTRLSLNIRAMRLETFVL